MMLQTSSTKDRSGADGCARGSKKPRPRGRGFDFTPCKGISDNLIEYRISNKEQQNVEGTYSV